MNDDELVKEFLVECHENLDQLDQDLVTLEADPTNPEMLSRIFRAVHTIKGSCGFLGYSKLEWVTHAGENLLSRMREGELQLSAEVTTALLSLVDAVRSILDSIESTASEGDADYEPLIATLTRLQEAGEVVEEASSAVADAPEVATDLEEEVPAAVLPSRAETLPDSVGELRSGRQGVEQFLMESYEHADQLDLDLVTFEVDPTNPELLSRIAGTLHTLKSSSGFMGFPATESATHEAENLLGGLRDGTYQLNPETTTSLLSLVDMLRQALVAIETTGKEEEVDYEPLLATLRRLQGSSEVAAAEASESVAPHDGRPQVIAPSNADTQPPPSGIPTAAAPKAVQEEPTSQAVRAQSVADTSIRVDVRLLDLLMDQVGELVLARNRIMQFGKHQEDRRVIAAYQRLDLITSELQEGVMKTRMQPIGTIWNKFSRVVRDLARGCGKQVNLNMDGEETELDRTLIEAIRDPLTHLVRNAVDHGIETPEARRLAGKSETGNLFLRAYHEGGQVIIEIADDGGGIDPDRIAARAIERSLITAQQASQMSERDILNLIFTAGFSTAETVTNVSGRGVGMDVVKNNIEKINGAIDVQSHVGKGSTIRIKIPLTLAIIPALVIRCAGDRYAIPQTSLIELLRLEGDDASAKIETIQGVPVYRLRGKLLPLVFLQDELAVEPVTSSGHKQHDNHVINIVVLQADERQFGLVVENVLDTEEIVVKPLGKQDIDVFAGATIMGDGTVALILDVLGLAQRANVVSERRESLQSDTSARDQEQIANYQTLLLFESAAGDRMALPLARVTRLEKFAWNDVEHSGQCEVVQYWGQAMPLIHVSSVLEGEGAWPSKSDPGDTQRDREVVVLTMQSGSIGLVVDHIIDTVEGGFEIQPLSTRAGVAGTVVLQERVTELLDVDEIIQIASPTISSQLLPAEVEG
jgi:two-component system chemotaxis sensor kinase CheA